ncbi:MAG: Nif11-like leader peptide family natural product precursor [Phototrophicaceae bacterium]
MALATALEFLERMEREDSLRTQLYITRPEDIYELTTFAQGKGFVMSTEDLVQALDTYQERFPTGTIEPLKAYLKGYKRLPQASEEE